MDKQSLNIAGKATVTPANIRFNLCPGDVVLELFRLLTTLVLGRHFVLFNRAQYKPVNVSEHY